MESIQTVINVLNRKCNMIFDRGYDDNKIIEYVDQSNNYFVIRMNDKRNFYLREEKRMLIKKRLKEKGKIRMTIWFEEEKYEVSVSHTKSNVTI